MKRPPFYNTTGDSGDSLKGKQEKAASHEDMVLEFFRIRPNQVFAPHQVYEMMKFKGPLTSIRKHITNLTDNGDLVKTGQKVMGEYGHEVNTWRYKNKAERESPQRGLF